MRKFVTSLFGQVLIAAAIGAVVGLLFPSFAAELKPLSDGFITLIKMIITPLVFCVVVAGIAGAGELKRVGRVGLKTVVYFEVITTVALVLGLVLALVFQPGAGMNVDPASLDAAKLSTQQENAAKLAEGGPVGFVLGLIPTSVIGAFAEGNVLQVLLFAVLFGCGLLLVGEKARPVGQFIETVTEVLFKVVSLIVRLAPLGVLGAVAVTAGNSGGDALVRLGWLVVLFYVAVAVFVVVILGFVTRLAGFNIFKLIGYLREEVLVVLGTASSDSVLPQVMRKLEHMGIRKSTVGLVIPTGYSFNLDAFSIYLTLAAVFIGQATGVPLSIGDLLVVLLVALITSKGAHGIPGSAIVVLAATLSAIPTIPVAGLVLVLSVDWFMGMARAAGNLLGNSVAAVVIGAWEGDIDKERATSVLNGEEVPEIEPEPPVTPVTVSA
ncbi:C4-dicarboxylate transporter DctA [Nonomuraea sp. SYSU D8015]|uniref:C4-dicarboxylate transporter DctA n=1 Tax=Nonomuraea sp. SYSU D8015 TaxID=2593644 RepID=UPI001660C76F|nr:C4-dicarboxylate transporter DctA [Nonomuraea sp. SYSU D8015]